MGNAVKTNYKKTAASFFTLCCVGEHKDQQVSIEIMERMT
jgi:hypothetical protein